jgi:hypothetical protein
VTDIREVWESFEPPEGLVAQFVGGQIVMQASPTMLHDMIIRNVVRQDWDGVEAWGERGIDCGPDSEPQPDLAWVSHEDLPSGNPILWPTGILHGVAEVVSPTSERMDRKIKPEIYASSGIPVYVIIDPRPGDWELYMLGPGRSYVLAERGPFGTPVPLPLRDGRRVLVDTTAWHPYPSV